MFASITSFITEQVARFGYPGILLMMLLGSACIPIPSEVVLLFGGALASAGFAADVLHQPGSELGLIPVMIVALVGSMLGSWLSYGIGAYGGRPLIDRWGTYALLRPHEVDRVHVWFEHHGEVAVFWSRMIPFARAFISLPAGVAKMDLGTFSLYTLLGTLPWVVGLTLAGYAAGQHWSSIEKVLQPVGIALAILAVAALVWWVARRMSRRKTAVPPAA